MFIHQRHAHSDMPKLLGWWGHRKQTRFRMDNGQLNMYTVEDDQLYNLHDDGVMMRMIQQQQQQQQ